MKLTNIICNNSKPKDKAYKLFDGQGLYLEITPSGGKLWRLKYRFGGKEKRLALGAYPEISILEAREKKTRARKQLAEGIDPSIQRKDKKAQIIEDENTEARGSIVALPTAHSTSKTIAHPVKFSKTPPVYHASPPHLGSATGEILTDMLDLSEGDLQTLIDNEVLG